MTSRAEKTISVIIREGDRQTRIVPAHDKLSISRWYRRLRCACHWSHHVFLAFFYWCARERMWCSQWLEANLHHRLEWRDGSAWAVSAWREVRSTWLNWMVLTKTSYYSGNPIEFGARQCGLLSEVVFVSRRLLTPGLLVIKVSSFGMIEQNLIFASKPERKEIFCE